jgi:hypothetical protein
MRIRILAAASLVVLAGCASSSPPSSPSPSSPAPSVTPSVTPSSEEITGTLSAGVEPHCLILRDAAGSHSIYFHDESLRKTVPTGRPITLIGHPEPGMMTTCQQGEPFIVTGVRND